MNTFTHLQYSPVARSTAHEAEGDQRQGAAFQKADPPVQRKLPHDGMADTKGYYNAVGAAKTKAYAGGRPANFSTAFKQKMVKNEWEGAYNKETDLWYVKTVGPSGVILPTNAIQIDHTVPWETIEGKLKEDPSAKVSGPDLAGLKGSGYVMPSGDKYTLYAARMYYHDVENLKPWAGSENASKGSQLDPNSVAPIEKFHNRMARSAGVHGELMKAAQGAFDEWGYDAAAQAEIFKELDNIDDEMINTEDVLKGM